MKYGMYCIRDVLTGFMTPVLEQNAACAMRNFRMACSRPDSLMNHKASDFSIYHIADFDSDTGILYPISPIELVCNGGSKDDV